MSDVFISLLAFVGFFIAIILGSFLGMVIHDCLSFKLSRVKYGPPLIELIKPKHDQGQ